MKKQSGFTLIELLLVLAIIGIISAIAIPALLGQRARARDKAVMANVTSIVSDLNAQWDTQKEAGVAMTQATCIGLLTAALPQFATAKNPWNSATAAYAAVAAANGAAAGPAVPATVGLVNVGVLLPAAGVPGNVGATGLLNSPINGSTTFSAVAGID
jgi:prepilin-type N-terminal cleavage/methylation domain-containing protein